MLQITYSEVKAIEIDERGRVSNWPPGFLDESVSEARLLLDLMYGGSPESEGGEP
jgi:predicted ATPase